MHMRDPPTPNPQDIKRHDQGVYRCRVDFRTSQTQSFRYNLTIISKLTCIATRTCVRTLVVVVVVFNVTPPNDLS